MCAVPAKLDEVSLVMKHNVFIHLIYVPMKSKCTDRLTKARYALKIA